MAARTMAGTLQLFDARPVELAQAKNVLVCATGGLGNTLLLVPLLEVLRAKLPGARIRLVLTNRAATMLAGESGWADDVQWIPESEWYKGLAAIGVLRRRLNGASCDVCLRTFLTAPAMLRASLAAYLSGARIRVAFGSRETNPFETHVLAEDGLCPEVDRHLSLARALGLETTGTRAPLSCPGRGLTWAKDYLASRGYAGVRPLLGLHPGSDPAYRAKRWPARRFGELAERASRVLNMQAVLIGGPDEADTLKEAEISGGREVWKAVGQDIVQTAGLIRRCTVFVSNDSGLMHLSSAFDVPTVALFGPTDPVKNRPLGPRTIIHRLGIECSPCDRETAMHRCDHHACLESMTVDQVFIAVRHLLATLGDGRHPASGQRATAQRRPS